MTTSRPTAEYGAPYLPITSTTSSHPNDRCAAARPDDPTLCDGPVVVTVRDAQGTWVDGCEYHAAGPASLEGGRIRTLPHAPAGAVIRVLKAAGPRPAVPGTVVITCPSCQSTRTREFGLAIPVTHDDYADCAGCLNCGHTWGLDPGADGACTNCGGSGDNGGTGRHGRCPCLDALPAPEAAPGVGPGTPVSRERIADALLAADTYAQLEKRADRERFADAVLAVVGDELATLRARATEPEGAIHRAILDMGASPESTSGTGSPALHRAYDRLREAWRAGQARKTNRGARQAKDAGESTRPAAVTAFPGPDTAGGPHVTLLAEQGTASAAPELTLARATAEHMRQPAAGTAAQALPDGPLPADN